MEKAQSLRVGDPLDSATYLGPVITGEQQQLVLEAVGQAGPRGGPPVDWWRHRTPPKGISCPRRC